jgi:hypothetical protein
MPQYAFNADLRVDASGDVLAVDAGGDSLAVYLANIVVMPNPWTARAQLLDFGSDIVPPTGGAAQRIGRLGSRFAVTFSAMPALGVLTAQALLSLRAAARANGDGIVFAWPQAPFTAAIGAPVVVGAGQAGTALAIGGVTPSSPALTAGWFFSFDVAGRNYLHCLTADAAVDGGGAATLSIAPMLRASPADGQPLNFIAPQIEGFIDGSSEDWTLDMLASTGLPAFTVTERA